MKKEFTPDYIITNKGCYDKDQVTKLSFISKPEISINDIIDSEIPLKDKYWFIRNKCELTTLQKQWLAIGLAEVVLEIYERKYPAEKAPRNAIQAAKDFLNGIIDRETLLTARMAAYAAAAYAAYAAAADAYAAAAAAYADAAAYAAYDAAYDADAAAYAAYAAAYAAADAAAYDADADADADAYDADADADAAAYAAAYAAAADAKPKDFFKNAILSFLKDFIKNN